MASQNSCRFRAVDDTLVNRASRVSDSDGAVEARGRFSASVMVIDCIDTDLVEPGAEWVACGFVSSDRAESLEEDLRGDVLGGLLIPETAEDEPIDLPEVVVVQLPKGAGVLLGTLD